MTALVPFLVVGIAEDDTIGAGKNIVAGASLNIIKSGGGVASIYSDEAGTTPISLPTTLDSSGQKMIFIAAGAYDVVIGGVSRRHDIIGVHSSPFVVETFAALATTPAPTAGMIVYLKQHTTGGAGGGYFIDKAGAVTNNGGTLINNTASPGRYWERIGYTHLSPDDFGATGVSHGSAPVDVTAEISSMINWINTGGTKRIIIPPLKYGISQELPQIVRSSVVIEGSGMLSSQDGGITEEHTLFEWIGGIEPAKRMFLIAPVSSITSARLDGVKFRGINIDCASKLGIGIALQSMRNSEVEVYVKNPTYHGMQTGVVATLGESRDFRDNIIDYTCRCLDGAARGAIGLFVSGLPGANSAFNIFRKINISGSNQTQVVVDDADNNIWMQCSIGKSADGSAANSIEFRGKNLISEGVARSEKFINFSSNLPAIIRGTSSYTYPAKNIKFYNLDKENGCPDPIVETGATAYWEYDNSSMYPSVWATYTPVITANTGSFTSVSATGRYVRVVGGVNFSMSISIATNGTAAGFIKATLPMQAGPACNAVCKGYETTAGNLALRGTIVANGTQIGISNDNGSYPGANGLTFVLSGFYETAQ